MAKRKPDFVLPEWVSHELENWARWCWRGSYPHPIPPQQCSSLEGNYSRYGEDTDSEAIDSKPIPVNESNAKIVQGVYEILPNHQQQVLRAEYPQKRSCARKRLAVQLGKQGYEDALNSAMVRVMMIFERG